MADVIDASLQLRAIKHEIYSSRAVEERPFRDTAALAYLFEVLYHYTDWVTSDFSTRKSELSALQARAQEDGLDEEEALLRKATVWKSLEALPTIHDMLTKAPDEARRACRADLERRISPLRGRAEAATKTSFPDPSWLVYETAEGLALELLTGATLAPAVAAGQPPSISSEQR